MSVLFVSVRQICKLVFYLLWQMRLPPFCSDSFPSVLVCEGPITTVYLIWIEFDTLALYMTFCEPMRFEHE